MSKQDKVQELPDELLANLLARAPEVSQKDLKGLASAVRNLDHDAEFLADYLKGLIVEDVRRAMDDEGVSQNALADQMGKSRQYLNKVLDQDRRVNFTIDTLAQLSTALNRRLFIRMLGPTETATIFHVVSESQTVCPLDEMKSYHAGTATELRSGGIWSETHYTPNREANDDRPCLQYG